MRVTRRISASDERGISAIITALALVAIFAMVVLVIDAGALLVKRRAMVKASDAAALAAAQSCVRETGDAESQADTFATLNASGSPQGGIIAGSCSGTYVTVRYTVNQPLYFAPVLGFGNSDTVAANATAAWGGAGAANPLPIVLFLSNFQGDCNIPDVAKGTVCHMWYDNNKFGDSNFGFLNLSQWNVGPTDHCSSAGSSQRDAWIHNDWPGDPLPLNYPDPTYVCSDSGLSAANWAALEDRIGDIVTFPINDPAGQIIGGSGTIEKYDIIGFAQMKLNAVLDAHAAGADSGTCSVDGINFPNASPINLDAFGSAHGCFTSAPDTVSNVTVSSKHDPITTAMYNYDAATRTLSWSGPVRQNTTVSFDWQNEGVCGTAPNSSARCILVEWVGHRFGGEKPGGGADFGFEGIRLCDLKFAGSCPTSS